VSHQCAGRSVSISRRGVRGAAQRHKEERSAADVFRGLTQLGMNKQKHILRPIYFNKAYSFSESFQILSSLF